MWKFAFWTNITYTRFHETLLATDVMLIFNQSQSAKTFFSDINSAIKKVVE